MERSAKYEEVPSLRLRPPVGLGLRELIQTVIYVAVLLALFLVGPRLYPNYFFFFYLMDTMLLVFGLNIIYGFTGYLPFGYTVFWGLGAYGVYIATRIGIHGALAFAFSVAITLALAAVLLPLFRLRSHYFAIATLAALMSVYYLIQSSTLSRWTNGDAGASLVAFYNPTLAYRITLVLLLLALVLTIYVKNSRLGLALRAIRGSVVTAELDGVNVTITRGLAWLLSALLAALSGAMYGWYITFFYPDMFDVSNAIYIITYLIFGGAGTVTGPIVGSIVLSSLYQYLNVSYTQYLNIIFGILLVLLILFLPEGVVGVVRRYARKALP